MLSNYPYTVKLTRGNSLYSCSFGHNPATSGAAGGKQRVVHKATYKQRGRPPICERANILLREMISLARKITADETVGG
jgi:hypothetical protein